MDGYDVQRLDDVVETADVFVTATGNRDVITVADMRRMKHQAVVGNIGHFDNEIDMAGLAGSEGVERIGIKPQVDQWVFPDGKAIILLSEGRLLNLGGQPQRLLLLDRSRDGREPRDGSLRRPELVSRTSTDAVNRSPNKRSSPQWTERSSRERRPTGGRRKLQP